MEETVKIDCVSTAAYAREEGRNTSQRERARNEVSSSKSLCNVPRVNVSTGAWSGGNSSGRGKHWTQRLRRKESDRTGKKEEKRKKYDNIHFATQASREQARLGWRYQPTAVTV